jgi:putative ABC transport system permease protein
MMNDIRYALRTLLKNPGFTTVAVITLALGIGANTAIFSVVNGVVLRPLPYPNASALVQVWTTSSREPRGSHAAANFLEVQRNNRTLAAIAGYREDAFTIASPQGEPVRVSGALVTADYFDVLASAAVLGRTFSRTVDTASTEPLAVLSHKTWTERFGSDSQIVGRRARVNGVPHTIVGVMPEGFAYPEGASMWVLSPKAVPLPPIDVEGDLLESRGVHFFQAVARLKPGVTIDQARADLSAIADDQARRFPEDDGGRGIALQPLHEKIVGDVQGALFVLLGAVGVVLLIACANVASLLLARASGRQREIAVRAALGASRGRLVRQLITESFLLGAAGGIAGLLAGSWAVALLITVLPEGIPRADLIGLDARVASVAILISLASAVFFGLIPALQASRTDASLSLRDADRSSTGGRRRAHTRAALVIVEIALTLVLLVSAALLANSFIRLQRVDPGFRADQVTLVSLPVPQSKYPDGKHQAAFYQRVLDSVEHRAEIHSAAILFPNPIQGNNAGGTFTVEGKPVTKRSDRPVASIGSVSSNYFRTLGIPVIQGRTFTEQDRDPAPAVAVVNATLARRYLDGEDPIGKRVRFGEEGDDWITIVGVVGDSHNLGLQEPPSPLLYFPYHRFPLAFMSLATRSAASASVVGSIVRAAVKDADPDMPIERMMPLGEVLQESVAEPRFRTLLLGAFAAMAVILAAVGLYGLISYSVTQRTREIGIRVALGAQATQVILPIVREGVVLALAGIAIGLGGAVAATQLISTFLFGVGPTDPLTFGSVALLLLMVALLASYIPSRRALRIDPIAALRAE